MCSLYILYNIAIDRYICQYHTCRLIDIHGYMSDGRTCCVIHLYIEVHVSTIRTQLRRMSCVAALDQSTYKRSLECAYLPTRLITNQLWHTIWQR